MHICLIAGELDWSSEGGGETYFSYVARLLSARHQVTVWSHRAPPPHTHLPFEVVSPDGPAPSIPSLHESLEPVVQAYARSNWVAQSLAGRGFDAVESPDYAPWSALLRPAFEAHDISCGRYAVSLHGILTRSFQLDWIQRFSPLAFEQTRSLEHLLIASADLRIAMGRSYAREWSRRVGRPVSMILPVTPFIEEPFEERQSCTPPDICAIARMQRWKGLEVLALAMGDVPSRAYGTLQFIGRDQTIDSKRTASGMISALLERAGVSRVEFRGSMSRSALLETLRARPICVFPSLWDTFNLTALEATLCGCPVVVSRACGIAEFFDLAPEDLRPALVEPDDPRSLADAITRTLQHISAARDRARSLGDWVRELLNVESVTQAIERAYSTGAPQRRDYPELNALCAIGRSLSEARRTELADGERGYEVELMRNLTLIARDYERAMSLYEARWKEFSGSAEGHYLYGVCLLDHRRNYQGAIHHFTRSLEIGGQDEFSVLSRRGLAHFHAGNLREAREDLARAHWLNPGDTAVRALLGQCLERAFA